MPHYALTRRHVWLGVLQQSVIVYAVTCVSHSSGNVFYLRQTCYAKILTILTR